MNSVEPDLCEWNDASSWRSNYQDLADGYLFFAEDVFGGQFAIDSSGEVIVSFDPETARTEVVAVSVDDWAGAVLKDYDYLTGHSLAHSWQERNGKLRPAHRLLPKLPFVAGGKYEAENLYSADSVNGMRLRGDLAVQIRSLPDGAKIRFNIVE